MDRLPIPQDYLRTNLSDTHRLHSIRIRVIYARDAYIDSTCGNSNCECRRFTK